MRLSSTLRSDFIFNGQNSLFSELELILQVCFTRLTQSLELSIAGKRKYIPSVGVMILQS